MRWAQTDVGGGLAVALAPRTRRAGRRVCCVRLRNIGKGADELLSEFLVTLNICAIEMFKQSKTFSKTLI